MALKAGIPRKVLKEKTYRDSVGDQEMKRRDTERRTKDSRGNRKIAKEDKRSRLIDQIKPYPKNIIQIGEVYQRHQS